MRNTIQTLIRWEWLILLLFMPLFLFAESYRALVLVVIPLLWLGRKWLTGHFLSTTPYDIAILLMCAMIALSAFVSFDPALHYSKIVALLAGMSLFYAIVEFTRHHDLWSVVVAFFALGWFVILVGIVGVIWLPPFDFLNAARAALPAPAVEIPGAVGGLINANELAGVLNWVAPLAFACSIGMGRRLWRKNKAALALLLLTTILTGAVLIATLSRGGILAYGVGLTVVLILFAPPRWRLVLITGFTVTLLILVSYVIGNLDRDIVGDTLGLSGRIEIWSRALLTIADYPITGVGINGFRGVIHVLYPLFGISADIDLAHAHNHLLQITLDMGLPGLIGYLALWLISGGLLWAAGRSLARRKALQHPYYTLVVGLAGSLAAGWVFGIFDAVALGARPSFLWWMLLGLTASSHYVVVHSGIKLRIHSRSSTSYPVANSETPVGRAAAVGSPSSH